MGLYLFVNGGPPNFPALALNHPTPELEDWVARAVPTDDLWGFAPQDLVAGAAHLPLRWDWLEQPPFRLNELWWPTGASRWGRFHTVITGDQYDALKPYLGTYTPSQGRPLGEQPFALGMNDYSDPDPDESPNGGPPGPGNFLGAETGYLGRTGRMLARFLWALPPRPLLTFPGDAVEFQASVTPNSNTLVAAANQPFVQPGMSVAGPGLPADAVVLAGSGASFVLSKSTGPPALFSGASGTYRASKRASFYLLTLVDRRYHWWGRTVPATCRMFPRGLNGSTLAAGGVAWGTYFDRLVAVGEGVERLTPEGSQGANLGGYPTFDLDAAYGFGPPPAWDVAGVPPGPVLDAAALAVGLRFVYAPASGGPAAAPAPWEYGLQSYRQARAFQDQQLALSPELSAAAAAPGTRARAAGGPAEMAVLARSVPERVRVFFPVHWCLSLDRHRPHTIEVTLAECVGADTALDPVPAGTAPAAIADVAASGFAPAHAYRRGMSDFALEPGLRGAGHVTGQLAAVFAGEDPADPATPTFANDDALDAYAKAAARDYYLWHLADLDLGFDGVAAWNPNGLNDAVAWSYRPDDCSTRVYRARWPVRTLGVPASAPSEGGRLAAADGENYAFVAVDLPAGYDPRFTTAPGPAAAAVNTTAGSTTVRLAGTTPVPALAVGMPVGIGFPFAPGLFPADTVVTAVSADGLTLTLSNPAAATLNGAGLIFGDLWPCHRLRRAWPGRDFAARPATDLSAPVAEWLWYPRPPLGAPDPRSPPAPPNGCPLPCIRVGTWVDGRPVWSPASPLLTFSHRGVSNADKHAYTFGRHLDLQPGDAWSVAGDAEYTLLRLNTATAADDAFGTNGTPGLMPQLNAVGGNVTGTWPVLDFDGSGFATLTGTNPFSGVNTFSGAVTMLNGSALTVDAGATLALNGAVSGTLDAGTL